jgi:hypothetical protein
MDRAPAIAALTHLILSHCDMPQSLQRLLQPAVRFLWATSGVLHMPHHMHLHPAKVWPIDGPCCCCGVATSPTTTCSTVAYQHASPVSWFSAQVVCLLSSWSYLQIRAAESAAVVAVIWAACLARVRQCVVLYVWQLIAGRVKHRSFQLSLCVAFVHCSHEYVWRLCTVYMSMCVCPGLAFLMACMSLVQCVPSKAACVRLFDGVFLVVRLRLFGCFASNLEGVE